MRLTWTLWHALNHPPTLHPLFWLIRRRSPVHTLTNRQITWVEKGALVYLALLAGLLVISSTRLFAVHPALLGVLVLLLTLPLIVLALGLLQVTLFAGTYHGLVWAIEISRLILHEREKRTFDLLCLFPAGALAGVWAIITGHLYRGGQFNNALQIRLLILRGIALLATLYLTPVLLRDIETFLWLAALTAIFLFALYLDFVQSAVLAVQVAILAALHTDNTLDARLWAAGGFLALQILSYAFTLTLGAAVLPYFLPAGLPDWLPGTLNGLLMLGVFYSARAGLIWLMWQGILYRLNTHTQDLDEVFAPGQPRLSGVRPASQSTL